jgi:mRNA-degrading endonuclease RelE of RelBE toxin-antitoxin system
MAEIGYRLRIPQTIVDLVRGLHPLLKANVKGALRLIIDDPYSGKPLKDDLEGYRSLRVKKFRIVYRLSTGKHVIEIIAIGPRKYIYEETFRIIKKENKST